MFPINFDKYKDKFPSVIEKRLKSQGITDAEGFVLVQGFISSTLQETIGGGIVLGGKNSLPTVAVIAKTSGLVYSFAAKSLIEEIDRHGKE